MCFSALCVCARTCVYPNTSPRRPPPGHFTGTAMPKCQRSFEIRFAQARTGGLSAVCSCRCCAVDSLAFWPSVFVLSHQHVRGALRRARLLSVWQTQAPIGCLGRRPQNCRRARSLLACPCGCLQLRARLILLLKGQPSDGIEQR